jgi:hypothetical protein
MEDGLYQELLDKARARGYDVSEMRRTQQTGTR